MDAHNSDDAMLRHNRLDFYQPDMRAIDKLMKTFLERSQVASAILVDQQGLMIAHYGEDPAYDVDGLCALLAGSFAATREWAKLLGEDGFSNLAHEGKTINLQLSMVAERALLVVISSKEVQLGMVRLMVSEAIKKLVDLFEEAARQGPSEEAMQQVAAMQDELQKGTDSLLDDLFGGD